MSPTLICTNVPACRQNLPAATSSTTDSSPFRQQATPPRGATANFTDAATLALRTHQLLQTATMPRTRIRQRWPAAPGQCAGSAGRVTVVVVVIVVVIVVVVGQVDGVDGASVGVVTAARRVASSATGARHRRGCNDIDRINAAAQTPATVKLLSAATYPWPIQQQKWRSIPLSRSSRRSCKQRKTATTSDMQVTARNPKSTNHGKERQSLPSLKPAAHAYHRRRHHHQLAEACCRTVTSAHTIGKHGEGRETRDGTDTRMAILSLDPRHYKQNSRRYTQETRCAARWSGKSTHDY